VPHRETNIITKLRLLTAVVAHSHA
jgi:hypothetical protein